MCLEVYANGIADGKGTHVSVVACLMKGDNDDSLSWPFTGSVTFELLNQLEDKNPITRKRHSHSQQTIGPVREWWMVWEGQEGATRCTSHTLSSTTMPTRTFSTSKTILWCSGLYLYKYLTTSHGWSDNPTSDCKYMTLYPCTHEVHAWLLHVVLRLSLQYDFRL